MNRLFAVLLTAGFGGISVPAHAQLPNLLPQIPAPIVPRPLPSPELQPSTPQPSPPLQESPQPIPVQSESEETILVSRFEYRGNTIFSRQDLDKVASPYLGRRITFAALLQFRAAITRLYTDHGYVTSAAYIPTAGNEAVTTNGGIVVIQIVEGKLEQLNISGQGSDRIANYVRSRLVLAASPVLNDQKLIEALRLLQIDPLLQSISANLAAGSQPGLSVLNVTVEASSMVTATINLNNRRSPTVGTFERGLQLRQTNLLGLGDALEVGYANTDGSHQVDLDYSVPVNPRDGTVSFRYSALFSRIVEDPFNELDIRANSRIYELTFRQPLFRSATSTLLRELAIGVTASRVESDTSLLGVPFPLSAGSDEQGQTRLSVLRFFQEYTHRSNQRIWFVRSQFSVGLDVLGTTTNAAPPDSRFFVWQGQFAFLQPLGTGPYLLVRTDLQFADRPLVPLEQFSLGGPSSIRGYRQDALLGDSGVLGSLELHYPVLSRQAMALQLIPFFDVGYVWGDSSFRQSQRTLASFGLGAQWTWGHLIVNLSYGVPLIHLPSVGDTLQENGLNGSLRYVFTF